MNIINNNNNNINMTNNNHKGVKFGGVQQVNSSSKMLDNHKYQKYFSKRKLVQQYEQEMRQEKRNKMRDSLDDDDGSDRPLNMRRSDSTTEDDIARTPDNGECVGLNLINIKREKGDEDHTDVNGNEEVGGGGGDTIGFYGSMDKIKHSILEPNIVLQHSDEVLTPTNGNKSLANSLQNTNLIQKTTS